MAWFFVYGTLKRGECREGCWPIAPRVVLPAYVRGQLYDLGPYPGLLGESANDDGDWVRGELWQVEGEAAVVRTLEVLDAIEGYRAKEDAGEYLRKQVFAYVRPQGARSSSGNPSHADDRVCAPEELADSTCRSTSKNQPKQLQGFDGGDNLVAQAWVYYYNDRSKLHEALRVRRHGDQPFVQWLAGESTP